MTSLQSSEAIEAIRDELVSVRFCDQPTTPSDLFSGMLVKMVSPRITGKLCEGVMSAPAASESDPAANKLLEPLS